MNKYSVIVVGGGSVGLSLAAELGWRGVHCKIIEKSSDLNTHPRANAVANRTMEYYRRWGIDSDITNAGIPPDHPADYYWVSSLHGLELHKVSLPPFKKIKEVNNPEGNIIEEHTWSPYLKTITGQNEVEKVVLNYIKSLNSVDISFDNELLNFSQDAEGVSCEIKNVKTEEVYNLKADYLVACDGGKSNIRDKLGIKLTGRADMAKFVSIYFKAPDFMKCHKFGTANIYFPLHKNYAGFLLNWDGGTTFTYHLMLKEGQIWSEVEPKKAIESVLGNSTKIEIATF